MTNIAKEAIGSFIVTLRDKKRRRLVVVSQKNTSYYNKDKMFDGKYFNLDHINGPEVFRTKDPKVFKLFYGTELLKRGHLQQSSNLELLR
jgi:hypothetical protein